MKNAECRIGKAFVLAFKKSVVHKWQSLQNHWFSLGPTHMRDIDLKDRTKQFALRIVRLYRALPLKPDAQVMGKQLLRAGTSVAANYRATCRARSKADFLSKIGVVLEEADETVLWLELLADSGIVPQHRMQNILAEANELVAILVASRKTAAQD